MTSTILCPNDPSLPLTVSVAFQDCVGSIFSNVQRTELRKLDDFPKLARPTTSALLADIAASRIEDGQFGTCVLTETNEQDAKFVNILNVRLDRDGSVVRDDLEALRQISSEISILMRIGKSISIGGVERVLYSSSTSGLAASLSGVLGFVATASLSQSMSLATYLHSDFAVGHRRNIIHASREFYSLYWQLVGAVEWIHKKGIIHGNINSDDSVRVVVTELLPTKQQFMHEQKSGDSPLPSHRARAVLTGFHLASVMSKPMAHSWKTDSETAKEDEVASVGEDAGQAEMRCCNPNYQSPSIAELACAMSMEGIKCWKDPMLINSPSEPPQSISQVSDPQQKFTKMTSAAGKSYYMTLSDENKQKFGLTRFYMDAEMPYSLHTALANVVYSTPTYQGDTLTKTVNLVIGGMYDPARSSDCIIPFPIGDSADDSITPPERHPNNMQFHRPQRVASTYKRYFTSFDRADCPDEYLYLGSHTSNVSGATVASFRIHRERQSGKFTTDDLVSSSIRSPQHSGLSIYPAMSDNWAVGLIGLEIMSLGYRIWGEDGADAAISNDSSTDNVVKHILLDTASDLDGLEWNNDRAGNWVRHELDAMEFDWRDIVRRKLILKDRAFDPTFVSDVPEGGSKYFPYSEEKLFLSSGFLSLSGKDLISLPLLSTHGDFSTGFASLDQIATTRLGREKSPRTGALPWPELPECIRGNSTIQCALFDRIRKNIRCFPIGVFTLQAIAGLLTRLVDIRDRNDSLKDVRQAMLRDMKELNLPRQWITAIDPLVTSYAEDMKDVETMAYLDDVRSNVAARIGIIEEFDDRMPNDSRNATGQGNIGDMIDFGQSGVEFIKALVRLASDAAKTHNVSVKSYSIELLASLARGSITQRCLQPLAQICSVPSHCSISFNLGWSIRAAKVFLEMADSLLSSDYEKEKNAKSSRPGTASPVKAAPFSCEVCLNNAELFVRASISLASAQMTQSTIKSTSIRSQRNNTCSCCCYDAKNEKVVATRRSVDICAREIIAVAKLTLARIFELRGDTKISVRTMNSVVELMTHEHAASNFPAQLKDTNDKQKRKSEAKLDDKLDDDDEVAFHMPSIATVTSAKIFQKISEFYDSEEDSRLDIAWKYMQVVLDIRKAVFGEAHICTLSSIMRLSDLHRRNSSLVLAKQFADNSMSLAVTLFGSKSEKDPGHLQIAAAHHLLALVCKDMKKFSDALQHIQRACQIRLAVVTNGDLIIAEYLSTHAAILEAMNDATQALQLLKQSLSIRQRALGNYCPTTANTYIALGIAQVRIKLFNEALESFSSAMSAREHIYGQVSHQVASVLNYKGVLYQIQGRLSDALHIFGKVLALRQLVFHGPHYDTGMVLLSIGNIYHSYMQSLIKSGPSTPELKAQIVGVANDAKSAFEKGISNLRDSDTLSRSNPNIVLSMFQLAGIHEYLAEKGVMQSKERLKSLGKERVILEEESLYGRPTIVAQGSLMIMEEAFEIIEDATFISEEDDVYMFSDIDEGEEAAIVAAIQAEEANRRACRTPKFEFRQKKKEVSEWISDENDVVEGARIEMRNVNERKLGSVKSRVKIISHPHALDVLVFLGMLRKDAKLIEEALEPLILAENILRVVHEYDHPRTFDAMVELAMVYQATGNSLAALNCLKRLLRGLRRNINPDIAAAVADSQSQPTLTKKKSYGGDEILGDDSEEVGTVLQHIAMLQQQMGFHEIAVDSFLAREKNIGFMSGDVGRTLLGMSESLRHMHGLKSVQQAKEMHDNALNIFTQVYGADHPETIAAFGSGSKKKSKWFG